MQSLLSTGPRRPKGWVQSYPSVTVVLVLVLVLASASLFTLWSSIQTIQRTLPAERLMRERDFAALYQDISRMRQALEVFALSPGVHRLDDLRLTMDIVSIRAKDNLRSYGGTEAGIDSFHADLKQWIAEFDDRVENIPAQQSPQSLVAFAVYVKGREAVWLALGKRAQTLNDDAFQSSIASANSQIEQLERLRTYLFLFIGLTALGTLALSLSLLRQRSAYQELQALDDEVRELAFLDPLTHLANRRLLLERLQHFLDSGARNGQIGALLYLDLDHFKMLNDTEGHDAGDELLQLIALRLQPTVRASDTVARFGGDEFVVLLEDLGTKTEEAAGSAEQVAEKIRAAFLEPFRLDKTAAGVWQRSVSIGVTVISAEFNSVDNVLRQADIALYQAKESGRNAVRFFDSAMQAAVQKHAAMESAMRTGIAAQEFLVFYQPMVDVNGRFCGAEALVRWKSSDGTLIAPGQFIPLAEESGLIVPLGLWIFQHACMQWVLWMELWGHRDLRLSVNVSAKQIHQSGFVDEVKNILETTGIPPHCLVVEVTESAILSNLEDTEKKLNALKAMGIGIALDDFGTGYSSLTYVQRLPFSELKIDQSFVANIGRDTGNEAICAATVALARGLGLRIVVEGVETPQQRDFFSAKHPIDYMQGYLFSKPLSGDAFAAFAQSAMGQLD